MRALLLCITLILISALPGWPAEVLILQSSRDTAYSEAVRGFTTIYAGRERTVVLSDYAEIDVVRLFKEERPRIIFAVGQTALFASRKVREVPVLTLLAPSVSHQKQPANVTGIGILAEPGKYLKLFNSMGKRRIGVIYDPRKSGRYVHSARQIARNLRLTLETIEVNNTNEVQSALKKLEGRVDAIWMLPDSTVVSAVNLEAFMLFSMANKVPVVSYLKQHLKSGAAASLDIDYFDLGRQAGELCPQLRERENLYGASLLNPRKVQLNTNDSVMQKLGVEISGW